MAFKLFVKMQSVIGVNFMYSLSLSLFRRKQTTTPSQTRRSDASALSYADSFVL